MSLPLNLAREPLRNERLPTLLLAVGCAVILGVSVNHALVARDLLPERTSGVDGELVRLEQGLVQLRRESEELKGRSASAETLQEWAAVRALVYQRAFSWSGLLGSLEEVTPADVRLTSIAPAGSEGEVELQLRAVGRTVEAGLGFLEVLQGREEFREPFLESVAETDDGVEFEYSVGYVPAAAPGGGS